MSSTLITALAVAITVTIISLIKNPRLKSLVYSLPIPISILLIATHGKVNISHLYGLFLVTGFLWLVALLHDKFRIPAPVAAIIGAAVYMGLGIVLGPTKHLSFWYGAVAFALWWVFFVKFAYRVPLVKEQKPAKRSVPDHLFYPLQAGVIFGLVVMLLSLVRLLAGAVVAFPLNGIFTVVVMRQHLVTLAGEFSRNSIGILLFFIEVRLMEGHIGLVPAILVGWVICLAVLRLLHPQLFEKAEVAGTTEP